MKRTLLIIGLLISLTMSSTYAQQYALIDMEYILERIPAYESANKQLESLSAEWQKKVDAEVEIVNALYKKYQADLALLAGTEKTKRENEIVAKEMPFRNSEPLFGPPGELISNRSIVNPIQDNIYEASRSICHEPGVIQWWWPGIRHPSSSLHQA